MSKYAAVLQGALHNSEEGLYLLRANLIGEMKYSEDRADHILANLPVTLRDGMTKDEALEFCAMVTRLGGKIELFDQERDYWQGPQPAAGAYQEAAPWDSPADYGESSYAWDPYAESAAVPPVAAGESGRTPAAGLEIWTDDQNLVQEFQQQVSKIVEAWPEQQQGDAEPATDDPPAGWRPIISSEMISGALPDEAWEYDPGLDEQPGARSEENSGKSGESDEDSALQAILARAFASNNSSSSTAAPDAEPPVEDSQTAAPPEVPVSEELYAVADQTPSSSSKVISTTLCLLLLVSLAFASHSYFDLSDELSFRDREFLRFDPSNFFHKKKKGAAVENAEEVSGADQDASAQLMPPGFDPDDMTERKFRGKLRVESIQGTIKLEGEGWMITRVGLEVSSERADKLSVEEILQGVEHPWLRRIDAVDLSEISQLRTPEGQQVFVGDAKAYIVDGSNSGRQIARVTVTIDPPRGPDGERTGIWRISRGIEEAPDQSVAVLERAEGGFHKMLIQGQFAAQLAK